MSLEKRLTIRLHRAQAEFHHSQALQRGLVGGVGSGKSFAGAYDLIRRALPDRLYMVATPTYAMLKDASLRSFLSLAQKLSFLRAHNRSDMTAILGNGAEVLFRSTDCPDRLRGPTLSGVWLDEASLMSRETYEIALGRLREGGIQGWLSATFTPKGRTGWTYEIFGRGGPDVETFHARTRDNPFAPKGFSERIAVRYSGLFARQELEGEFVSIEGAEYPEEYFTDDIWFDDWPDQIICRTIGLDPSKGRDAKSGDYAAFALLAVDQLGTLWVEAHLTRNHTAELLAELAVEHTRTFRPDLVAVEVNQFQQLLAVLIRIESAKHGILVPTVPLDNRVNKLVRIRRIGPYLQARRIRFRNTPGTRLMVDQLREFPEGRHDDAGDCLEMAIRVAAELLAGRAAPIPDLVVTT